MIGSPERGSAMPETAMVLGTALVILLGAVQMTTLGFSQISADGAAFVAAHTVAVDKNANGSAAAQSALPAFAPDAVALSTPLPNIEQATVSKNVDGFSLVPGAASAYALSAGDQEYTSGGSAQPGPFAFAIHATLNNYCDDYGACTPRSMYLAQTIDETGNGQGWNGPFNEWRCHQQYYASLNFPASRPSGGLRGSPYDPQARGTTENAIYSWDTGSSCR